MSLHEAASLQVDGPDFSADFPDSWLQGRSVFGGLQVATLVDAMGRRAEAGRYLREIHVRFLAPVAAGPASVLARVLRSGKAFTQIEGSILQNGSPACLAWASYAAERPGSLLQEAAPRPPTRPVEECVALPFIPGLTPTFTQHLEYRFAEGAFPFSGAQRGGFGGWCRLRVPSSHPAVPLVLMDAWPPPASPLARAPHPASTVSWSAHLLATHPVDPAGWWYFRADLVEACGGNASHLGHLWTPEGALGAHESQLVAMFA